MEQLTFGTCVKKSWISTWQAIIHMPGLFLGVFAVIACTGVLSASFQQPLVAGADFDPSTAPGYAFARLALWLLQLVASGCIGIKVSRFVLLGEGTQPLLPLGGKPLGRYLLFSLGIGIGMMIITIGTAMVLHPMRSAAIGLIILPLILVYLFIIVRLSLLYPALALGSPLTLPAAWKDSRGHFWYIMGVGFVTYLPLLVIWIVAMQVGGKALLLASLQGSLAVTIVLAFGNTLFLTLSSALMSWIYRRYANALLDHVAY
jgi:hypothetical protein